MSSPAPDAAAAECERAPGGSATVPAAASSPAPDAAAAECERAPGDAAACAHGDKKQEGSRAGTLFQYCRFRWRILESQCSKGWEPVSSPSEKEATVIRIKSKILSVGLGTWRCNETMQQKDLPQIGTSRGYGIIDSRVTRVRKNPYRCMFL